MREFPRKIVPLPAAPYSASKEVAGEDVRESTLSGSAESGLTIGSSGHQRSYGLFYCGNADFRLDDSSGWTNEKHNEYLDYLESSFVEQLYDSISLHSLCKQWRSRGYFPRFEQPDDSRDSIDQFIVPLNDCWGGKNQAVLDREGLRTSDKVHGSNPRCQRSDKNPCHGFATAESYFSGRKTNWVQSVAFPCGSGTNISNAFEYQPSNRNMVGSLAEASGQNFAEEDKENSNCPMTAKRQKRITETDGSNSNQVMPSGKSQRKGTAGATCYFPETDEEEELLYENPETFAFEGADIHHFLRGS